MNRVFLKRICFSFLFFALGLSGSSQAQTANAGRSAFDFLKISPVSRAMGSGEAYTAMGDDVGAVYYNPAGLASVLTNELNLTYLSLYQQMSYEFVAFATPVGSFSPSIGGVAAISVNLLQPGNMPRTNDQGQTVGTFSSGDSIFTLSYAHEISQAVHFGLTGKLMQQQIDTLSSSLFSLDAGLIVLPPFDGMRVGIALKNLGAQESSFDLPFSLNTGISYRRYELFSDQDDGAISVDAIFPIQPIEDKVGMRVGVEYNLKWIGNRATLRGGYQFLDTSLSGVGPTLGAGYGLDFNGTVAFLDYAYAPEDVFGDTHRISISTKF